MIINSVPMLSSLNLEVPDQDSQLAVSEMWSILEKKVESGWSQNWQTATSKNY